MQRLSVYDDSKNYQFLLSRSWDEKLPKICWILLNPSVTSDQEDDETIHRCIEYSKRWNYGAMDIVYLFAYRTTFIKDLLNREEPVGAETDRYILDSVQKADKVVLAWGGTGNFMRRNQVVLDQLKNKDLYCLKLLIDGNPAHPLFLPKHQLPIPFKGKFLVGPKKVA